MQILEGIKQKNFLVIGRVGMDMCPEPAGAAIEDATTMMVAMGLPKTRVQTLFMPSHSLVVNLVEMIAMVRP